MRLPETRTVPIEQVRPYDRNPRTISDEAVEAVRSSIENYGYVQPVLVDAQNVIVAGHVRYQALTALGVPTIDVLVADHLTPEQVRQYRLVDNRTAELTDWAHEDLVAELREWEEGLVKEHFPYMDLGMEQHAINEVTESDIEKGAVRAATINQRDEQHTTSVACPSCHGTFQVKTTTLPRVVVDEAFPGLLG